MVSETSKKSLNNNTALFVLYLTMFLVVVACGYLALEKDAAPGAELPTPASGL